MPFDLKSLLDLVISEGPHCLINHCITCCSCFNAPDIISVYNGIDTDSTIIKQFCSFHNGEEVLSRGDSLLVTFETDRSAEEQGFAASYEFVGEHMDVTPVVRHPNNTSETKYFLLMSFVLVLVFLYLSPFLPL